MWAHVGMCAPTWSYPAAPPKRADHICGPSTFLYVKTLFLAAAQLKRDLKKSRNMPDD